MASASTFAATIPVPQNLPPPTNVLTQTPSVTPTPNNKQKKRPRPEEKENNNDSSSTPKIIRIEAPSATAPIKTIPVTLMAAVHIQNADIEKLIKENNQLRQENELLKKQLSLFKQLIRNHQRLNLVLRRLEEKSQGSLKTNGSEKSIKPVLCNRSEPSTCY